MLTSFFSKSTPINYLIVGILILLGYVLINFFTESFQFELYDLVTHLMLAALAVFMMLLLDFVIRKNNLTGRSTYGIFVFMTCLLMVPAILKNGSMMLAVVCCMFAMRRILSFTSEKNIEKKILDAAVWLAFASFFYAYSLLFMVVLYYAILRSTKRSFRYFFIPPIGLAAVFMIASAVMLSIGDFVPWIENYLNTPSLDFSAYNSFTLLAPSSLFIALVIWVTVFRIIRLKKIKRKDRPNYFVLIVMLLTGVVAALAAPIKDGSELLFILPMLAIVTTDYIERREERYVKEGFLWILVITPLALLFF